MEFKVGDKVRRVNRNHGILKIGDVGEVVGFKDRPGGRKNVVIKGDEPNISHQQHNLELVDEPAPARSTDPITSKGKRKVNKHEQAVLDALMQEAVQMAGVPDHTLGMTGKEIANYSGHPLNCITPRFAPLRRKEKIKDSGQRRDKQIVWVLA